MSEMPPKPGQRIVPLVIIMPVRDEQKYLRLTLESLAAQTWQPREVIVVDDGSTDATPDIVREFAAAHPWIRLVKRDNRGFRQVGKGVVVTFDFGREQILDQSWQYITKLDGDMSFGPRYIEKVLGKLEADPKLAACSGKVFRPEGQGFVEEFMLDDMVAGQFKMYRREAFEAIGGFRQTILWDTLDWHMCRMKGWKTLSFHDPEARLIHHRIMGSSDRNVYKGRVRQGRGNWFAGYHPLYMLASGVFRMREKPYVIGGLILIGAYFHSLLRGDPQFDEGDFRKNLHAWQLGQLKRLPRRLLCGRVAGEPRS